jgi:hypothetical protein
MVLVLAIPCFVSAQSDPGTQNTTTTNEGTTADQGSVGFVPVLGWTKARDADEGKVTGGLANRLKLSPVPQPSEHGA